MMGLSFNREPRLPFAFKTCEVVLLLMAGYALKGSRHTLVLRVCVCVGGWHLMEHVRYHLDVQKSFLMKVGHT